MREYLAALRKLSEFCEVKCSDCQSFANLKDSLRNRLVCGLRSEQIQKKLLSESDLTLDNALETAVAMETAARDAVELQAKHTGGVNKLKVEKKSKPVEPKVKSHVSSQRQSSSECYRCNGRGHKPNVFTVTKNVTIAIRKVMRVVPVQKGNVVVRGDLVERK